MIPILICCVISLALPFLVLARCYLERVRRRIAERELGFWDANIVAALNGGAVQ